MIKRWLIRSMFLLPLVCVVAVWVASYFGGIGIGVNYRHWSGNVNAAQGETCFLFVPDPYVRSYIKSDYGPPTLNGRFLRQITAKDWKLDVSFPGFRYSDYNGFPNTHFLVFPLWLPTLLSAGLLWFVWRKTKPKKIGGAFPIEPTAKPGEPKL